MVKSTGKLTQCIQRMASGCLRSSRIRPLAALGTAVVSALPTLMLLSRRTPEILPRAAEGGATQVYRSKGVFLSQDSSGPDHLQAQDNQKPAELYLNIVDATATDGTLWLSRITTSFCIRN